MEQISNSNDLAVLVRQRRRELGLSQAQLAAKVGVSRQWVIDIEKGKPRAELELALALLQALGIELQVKMASGRSAQQKGAEGDAVAGEDKIKALAEAFDFL